MHKITLSLCFVLFALLLSACGEKTNSSASENEAEATPVPTAIALWSKSGLRDAPNAKGKFLVNVFLGEKMTLTGNRQEAPEEKRTYVEVTLSDGKTGWINDFLVAENASLAVAVASVETYRRPDITTLTGKSFETGQIIALKETDNPEWLEAVGEEKKVSGFVKRGPGISTVEEDIQVAILVSRARGESDKAKKEALLNSILKNPDLAASTLAPLAEEALNGPQRPELPSNQLYIEGDKVNIRTAPAVEGSEVAFQLTAGNVCDILEKGEAETINGNEDYWYRISHDGQEGWVFGFFTSKRINP